MKGTLGRLVGIFEVSIKTVFGIDKSPIAKSCMLCDYDYLKTCKAFNERDGPA